MLRIYIFEIYVKEIYVELILTSNSITWYFLDHVKYIIVCNVKKLQLEFYHIFFYFSIKYLFFISNIFNTWSLCKIFYVIYFDRNLFRKGTHSFLFGRILFKNYEKFVVQ